jgi:large subunit ribosomal protein L1
MAKRGRKYQEAAKLADRNVEYPIDEGVSLAKKVSYANFDATVEMHIRTGVDPRHADQQVRGVSLLPHGTGKRVRVLVFAQGEAENIAREAGADYVGSDELIKRIQDGWIEFDVTIATPDMMRKIGRLGRIIGRRGLMPSPRSGTVVTIDNLPQAVSDARKGRVEFRVDRTAIIHVPVGKVSFDETLLAENVVAMFKSVSDARPSGAKGQFIQSITLAPTMGPGVRIDVHALEEASAAI